MTLTEESPEARPSPDAYLARFAALALGCVPLLVGVRGVVGARGGGWVLVSGGLGGATGRWTEEPAGRRRRPAAPRARAPARGRGGGGGEKPKRRTNRRRGKRQSASQSR